MRLCARGMSPQRQEFPYRWGDRIISTYPPMGKGTDYIHKYSSRFRYLVHGIIVRPSIESGRLDILLAQESGYLRAMVDMKVFLLELLRDDMDTRLPRHLRVMCCEIGVALRLRQPG